MRIRTSTICTVAAALACSLVVPSTTQAMPFVDSPDVVALWHMDAIAAGDKVLDDDSISPRNRDLVLGNALAGFPAASKPTLTSGGGGVFGEALSLDGDDMGFGLGSWTGATESLDAVVVDFYFKETGQTGAQILVEATSTWEVAMVGNVLQFTTWLAAGGADTLSVTLDAAGDWRRVIATHDSFGNKTLSLDGVIVDSSAPGALKLQNKSITVGNKEGKTRYFTGLIDEVYVAVPEPASFFLLGAGGLLAIKPRRNG